MRKIKYTEDIIRPIIEGSKNFKEVFLKLGMQRTNGTHMTVRNAAKRYNIDLTHLTKDYYKNPPKFKTNDELFVENSDSDRSVIKSRILKDNLIKYECGICHNKGIWMGQKMPLILDHINGINNDSRLKNLRFLCSNCDSIQPTYKNRNSKNRKK